MMGLIHGFGNPSLTVGARSEGFVQGRNCRKGIECR